MREILNLQYKPSFAASIFQPPVKSNCSLQLELMLAN